MASIEAIAVMREKALARLSAALGDRLSTEGLDRDQGLAEAQLLERIADVLETGKEPEPELEPVVEEDSKPSFPAGKPKGRRA